MFFYLFIKSNLSLFSKLSVCTAGIIYFVNEHSTAVLRCPFKAARWYGPPNYTVYTLATQVNPQLSQTDRLNVNGSEYDLLISNVQHADAGEYRCTGTNNGVSISSYIQFVLTGKYNNIHTFMHLDGC